MQQNDEEQVQRWTSKRKSALVMSILKGETSIQEAARKHGLTVAELEEWKDRFLAGAELLSNSTSLSLRKRTSHKVIHKLNTLSELWGPL